MRKYLFCLLTIMLLPSIGVAATASLSIEKFDIKAGETKEMIIDLTNPQDEITLVQFDLSLPAGLSIKKVDGDYDIDLARTTWKKHSLDANAQADGTIRFLLASSSNAVLSGTEGAIIKMTLVADNIFSGGTVNMKDILLVTPEEKEIKPADVTITIAAPQGKEFVINTENFPDSNFRNYLLSQSYGADGVITEEEILEIKEIWVPGKKISSLKGIELFTVLEELVCPNNQLTSLDLSKNTALTSLYCYNNQLTSLDVSKNTALTSLDCSYNQLTSLDVSKNTALTRLDCYNNQLTNLDVSKNTALQYLDCSENQLTSLDVSKNTALTSLYCYNNQLTSLDVSKNTALIDLSCSYNQLTSLDLSKNTALQYLSCYNNNLTSLDVSKNTALTSLYCYNNQLTSLDVSKNTALQYLDCYNNQLTSLDVSKNTALTSLYCYNNQLTSLDVSNNIALTHLRCGNNQLTSLDVSNNIALIHLRCGNNQLTSLDVSKNTKLEELYCYNNQIKGAAMDNLISSLPQNTSSDTYYFCVIGPSNEDEGNICTKAQVAAVKAKSWFPCYYNNVGVIKYEGSDDVVEQKIVINTENFPDANFRNYLLSQSYGADGVITEEEILKITIIDVSEKEISSLKGIELFTSLWYLACSHNQLISLDVSKNTKLEWLFCYDNQLTSLDVSKNTELEWLYCDDNQLTSLDVSKNTALKSLACSNNQLTSLDVSKNTKLEGLYCNNNQLTSLDVSKNTVLRLLCCENNQLSNLDVSKNTALTDLDCYNNQLTSLDVSKNTVLTSLDCSYNQLTSLDVSKNTELYWLYCDNNQLTSLDVSKNTALTDLYCSNNQLTSLDVSKNTVLEWLSCGSIQLTALDVSKNTELTYLFVGNDLLTTLDVSKNTKLTDLRCSGNQIKGSAMDNLIMSLPTNQTDKEYLFGVIYTDREEGNVCTEAQVAAAKAKGWTPKAWNGDEWVEYKGSDDVVVPTNITLPVTASVNIGETITLTPTITPAGANTTLTWTTDDATIAKVTQQGVVVGIKEGTAIISVTTENNLTAECFVIVNNPSGISDITTEKTDTPVYTVSGQRLAAPRKGVNIIGGLKVVVR